MARNVSIVGCGVIGLAAAIRLLETGARVRVFARDLPPHTTSNVAAAFWHPYEVGPADSVARWAKRTFAHYAEFARRNAHGIRAAEALEVFVERETMPETLRDHPGVREARWDELPTSFRRGWIFRTMVVETGPFLEFCVARVRELGGSIERREIRSLDEVPGDAVVNSSGVWAGALTDDREIRPLRGEVLVVGAIRSKLVVVHDEPGHPIAYVVPRSKDCVLGGTAELDRWDLEPDVGAGDAIVERCTRLAPEVANARRIGPKVGLRPKRPSVRLERATLGDGRTLIHDYGHGGAGVTLAFGCADEVVELLGD